MILLTRLRLHGSKNLKLRPLEMGIRILGTTILVPSLGDNIIRLRHFKTQRATGFGMLSVLNSWCLTTLGAFVLLIVESIILLLFRLIDSYSSQLMIMLNLLDLSLVVRSNMLCLTCGCLRHQALMATRHYSFKDIGTS